MGTMNHTQRKTPKWLTAVLIVFLLFVLGLLLVVIFRPSTAQDDSFIGKDGYPLLLAAAYEGDLQAVRKLIEQGADVNQSVGEQIDMGETAIYYAAEGGHIEMVRYLLEHGAHHTVFVEFIGKPIELSALLGAVNGGHLDIVDYLLANGYYSGTLVEQYEKIILRAAARGHCNMVEYALEHKVNVNVQGHQGMTPLIIAISDNHQELLELLIKNGADIKAADDNGYAVWDYAQDQGPAMVAYLESLLKEQSEAGK